MSLSIVLLIASSAAASDPAFFRKQIAPIFEQHCVQCHASEKPKGGLSLTTAAALLAGGESGAAIVPGRPDESLLLEYVSGDKPEMPKNGAPLADEQVATLRQWISDGASWPADLILKTAQRADDRWWSLQPVVRPKLPTVKQTAWVRNPVDLFVLSRLESSGLEPAPPAERLIYLRRATLDLLGLPPTLEQIDAFVADESPDACQRLLERLLASPHYGERWARHWLDVVRWGESDGFEEDQYRDHAWRYRDYVIDSFNTDKPYMQFVREQLAGDVIEPVTAEGIVATGMLVAGPWDFAQNVAASETERLRAHEAQMEELVGVVSQTFLGLTVNCARCHDHKFDPILQTDYYRLKAVFDGVDHSTTRDHSERLLPPTGDPPALDAQRAADRDRLVQLRNQLTGAKKQLEQAPDEKARIERTAALQQLLTEIGRVEGTLGAPDPARTYCGVRHQSGPTHVYVRGEVQQPGTQVVAGGLSVIQTPSPELSLTGDSPEAERRLRFAGWVTDPGHPLTARVMVNRVWQYHFGRPLVENPSDFGFNGGQPSHPELLDWLTSEFVVGGYRLKSLHRLIMLSAAYGQSARFNPRAREVDADNRLLWRFQPRRLEGEVVRDAMLATSGQLDLRMGGPSFRPFSVTVFNTYFYHLVEEDRPEFRRRTIYRMNINTGRDPLLDALDCPAPSLTAPSRRHTSTALQSLALMNSPFVLRQAAQFAQRLAHEAGSQPAQQVALGYRMALGRSPSTAESVDAIALVEQHGLESLCWTLVNTTEFLYVR